MLGRLPLLCTRLRVQAEPATTCRRTPPAELEALTEEDPAMGISV